MKLPVVLSALLLRAAIHVSWAQTPVISSLQPESGPVGESVTITGTNFGTDLADIQVFFGTLPAVVTSVTPTAIGATVPAGAAHELVVVRFKHTSRTIYGPRPFVVTFESERDIRPGY
jgi:hypothetical protein